MTIKRIPLTLLALAALAAPARAAVVYVVPDNPINVPPLIPREAVFFDLDGNGVDDIAFIHRSTQIDALPQATTRVVATEDPGPSESWYVENLAKNTPIGPALVGEPEWGSFARATMNGVAQPVSGNFVGGFGYLGIEFDIDGETHYGWMEVESFSFAIHVEIHRWAYESEPGVGLLAGQVPEPGPVPLAALGLAALLTRRRRVPRG